jgi:uncharacterized protein (TIGR02271 family)
MLNNSSSGHETDKDLQEKLKKAIIIGIIAGGVIGALLGFSYEYGIFPVTGLSSMFASVPINAVVTGTFTGIVAGVIIGGLTAFFSSNDETNHNSSYVDNEKLQLREERLHITKKRIQTAEVNMHKESFTEEKTFTVPVTREELVIEKKYLDEDKSETIRIPIKDERVEIVKHPVVLEDVSYHIDHIQENKHIEETLKKENLKIEQEGSASVIDKNPEGPQLF